MRVCEECDESTTICPTCRRAHCDDPACPGMPVACVEAMDE